MSKVTMRTGGAGPNGTWQPGQVVELDAAAAAAVVAGGYGTLVEAPPVKGDPEVDALMALSRDELGDLLEANELAVPSKANKPEIVGVLRDAGVSVLEEDEPEPDPERETAAAAAAVVAGGYGTLVEAPPVKGDPEVDALMALSRDELGDLLEANELAVPSKANKPEIVGVLRDAGVSVLEEDEPEPDPERETAAAAAAVVAGGYGTLVEAPPVKGDPEVDALMALSRDELGDLLEANELAVPSKANKPEIVGVLRDAGVSVLEEDEPEPDPERETAAAAAAVVAGGYGTLVEAPPVKGDPEVDALMALSRDELGDLLEANELAVPSKANKPEIVGVLRDAGVSVLEEDEPEPDPERETAAAAAAVVAGGYGTLVEAPPVKGDPEVDALMALSRDELGDLLEANELAVPSKANKPEIVGVLRDAGVSVLEEDEPEPDPERETAEAGGGEVAANTEAPQPRERVASEEVPSSAAE